MAIVQTSRAGRGVDGASVTQASGGSAAVARTDPSETYRVIQTMATNTIAAAAVAAGASAENTPHAVATPLPPRNPSQIG